MFYEYALEPGVLSTWQSVRFFLDSFGPSKGRFLAEYPRKWKKMIFESLSCAGVEKLRIVERLNNFDGHAFSSRANASYDGTLSWRANVEQEHSRSPFRAVIVAEHSDGAFLEADSVTDAHPLWRVEPGYSVARTPAAFVQALRLLLSASRQIAIIDPYFRADQDDKLRPFVHLCAAVANHKATVELHACDTRISYHEFARIAGRVLPRMLPPKTSVTLFSWRESQKGERFHNRFLLTDIGGVQFGDSIECGEEGQTDRLSILGTDERARIWSFFHGPATAFEPAGPPIVISAIGP